MSAVHRDNFDGRLLPRERADAYNAAFPKRPPLAYGPNLTSDDGMVAGCWMIGACYKNPNPLYGAYPHGYLERVHAMFPDARKILHVFSGGLKRTAAVQAAWPDRYEQVKDCINLGLDRVVDQPNAWSMDLVDMHGPDKGRYPTWQGDLHDMPAEWAGRFDLVLADPPYSAADSITYDCPPPNRRKVMRSIRRVTAPGGNLVWLDQVWPQHRKTDWKTWGTIGLVRSTNHRMRLVSMFEAQ